MIKNYVFASFHLVMQIILCFIVIDCDMTLGDCNVPRYFQWGYTNEVVIFSVPL